jgi:hypothetical protein
MSFYAPYGSQIVSTESYRDSGYGSTPETRATVIVTGLTKPALSLPTDRIAAIGTHFNRLGRAVARQAEKDDRLRRRGVIGASGHGDVAVVPADWSDPVEKGRTLPGVAMALSIRIDFEIGNHDKDDVDAVIKAVAKMLRETRL